MPFLPFVLNCWCWYEIFHTRIINVHQCNVNKFDVIASSLWLDIIMSAHNTVEIIQVVDLVRNETHNVLTSPLLWKSFHFWLGLQVSYHYSFQLSKEATLVDETSRDSQLFLIMTLFKSLIALLLNNFLGVQILLKVTYTFVV